MTLSNSPKRILVAPLRFIGDGILTVPLLRELRHRYESAHIDVLLPQHMVNLLERCPYINEVLIEPRSKWALQRLIHSRRYHLGLVMRRSISQALVFKLAGIQTLVGYDEQRFPPPLGYRRWGWFLDHVVPFPPVDTEIPQVKTYLNLLSPLGASEVPVDESLELWADEADKLKIAALFNQYGLDAGRPIAVIHGTSASREKDLGTEKFVPAVRQLAGQGYQLIAVGAWRDREFYTLLAKRADVPLYNWCGETTLRQSYALMLKVHLLLSLDSAPIHMATAAGVPHIIGIYGATNEKQWRPYPYEGQFTPVYHTALSCRPCVPKVCSHNRCRVDLTAEQIAAALTPHLGKPLADTPIPS